jgi:KDO2-lipid IV(A) lauroyltransferase
MQKKMASRNRLVRAIASATSYVWFPMVLFVARYVPRRLARRVARWLGRGYFRSRAKYLGAVRANLSIILKRPAESGVVREIADAMVSNHFAAWLDFLHFASRPPRESARLVESVVGFSRIVEARQRGKGVLLLTAHLGNWEVGGFCWRRFDAIRGSVPDSFRASSDAPPPHAQANVAEIPIDHSFVPTLTVMRALESNGVVAMQTATSTTRASRSVLRQGLYFPEAPSRRDGTGRGPSRASSRCRMGGTAPCRRASRRRA